MYRHLIAIVAQRHSPIDMKSATKVSQLVQMANQRQIPLLFLQNSGDSSLPEKGEGCSPNDPDRLKAVAQLIACISCSPGSPKISLNIGGCFGEDLFAMVGKGF